MSYCAKKTRAVWAEISLGLPNVVGATCMYWVCTVNFGRVAQTGSMRPVFAWFIIAVVPLVRSAFFLRFSFVAN
jgi:hypothetical protein